jgi:hypothetical protein
MSRSYTSSPPLRLHGVRGTAISFYVIILLVVSVYVPYFPAKLRGRSRTSALCRAVRVPLIVRDRRS